MAKRPRRIPKYVLDAFRNAAAPRATRPPNDVPRDFDAPTASDRAPDDDVCPDCKGSGEYVGLVTRERCATCDGSGRLTFEERPEPLGGGTTVRIRIDTAALSPGDELQFQAHGRNVTLHCIRRRRDGRVTLRDHDHPFGVIVVGPGDVLEVQPVGSIAAASENP